jgi:[acyl-carrier-protein] S-malonyltransferase
MNGTNPVFVFPGQGAQHSGMGREVAESYPDTAGRIFKIADEILGFSLSRLCFEGTEEQLARTEITQPALFATSTAILTVLKSKNLTPSAAAGHSVGEYAALLAAGSIRFEEALPVVRLRGELMAAAVADTPGAMAAIIGLTLSEVQEICAAASAGGVVEPSNMNAPTQIVVSGETGAVLATMELAKGRGGRAVRLNVSAPFHCSLMAPVRTALGSAIDALHIKDPRVPVVANATGGYVRTAGEIKEALLDQVASPVRWTETVRLLLDHGHRSFVEVGPGKVLAGLIRAVDRSATVMPAAVPDDIEKLVAQ